MRSIAGVCCFLVACGAAGAAAAQQGGDAAIAVAVDAREAPRGVLHARLDIPVHAGPLTLLYPKWIPGEHGPTGPITNLAGVTISAGGTPLPWRRDDVDMYAFHVDVPPGVASLSISLDSLQAAGGAYSAGVSTSAKLAVVNWNQLVLYPAGAASDALTYRASLTVPAGWEEATALPVASRAGATVAFAPVSLTTLVDSPVLAGAYLRTIELGQIGGVPHFLHLGADSPEALEVPDPVVASYRRLVQEAGALFGATHYRSYHFLLTLSDHVEHFGLEHHESSDDRVAEQTLVKPDLRLREAGLLPHEFVHSWNGKFRRPQGLATPDYETPMRGELLWVYEGLTSYLGTVLTARSGLWTPDETREYLARTAAQMVSHTGREWRPLIDTTIAAQTLYASPDAWRAWRRSVDFYPEGVLLWLEVDTTIRRLSGGARSLDDFCRSFFGPPSGPPRVEPYTFDDLVAALDSVQHHDWRTFLTTRLDRVGPHAPLGGIEAGGWELSYSATTNVFETGDVEPGGELDLSASLGCRLDAAGDVRDVVPGSPAAVAGLAPAMKVLAIGGRRFSRQFAREAVARTAADTAPLRLVVDNDTYVDVLDVDYHGGLRSPHLERRAGAPDVLSEIIAPRTGPQPRR